MACDLQTSVSFESRTPQEWSSWLARVEYPRSRSDTKISTGCLRFEMYILGNKNPKQIDQSFFLPVIGRTGVVPFSGNPVLSRAKLEGLRPIAGENLHEYMPDAGPVLCSYADVELHISLTHYKIILQLNLTLIARAVSEYLCVQ